MKTFISRYRRFIILFMLLVIAVFRICVFEYNLTADLKKVKHRETVTVTCKVATLPSSADNGTSFFAEITDGINIKSRAYVKVKNLLPKDLAVGDKIKAKVKVSYPKKPLNKGGYDFEGYLKSKGASLVLTCDAMDFKITRKSPLTPVYKIRSRVTEDIFMCFDKDEASLINALVTGSKDEMSPLLKENFRRAGVYHIIAVSGLHLGLLLMFLMASFSGIKFKSLTRNLVTLAITFVGGMMLLVFTGFGISVQRAAFMALFLCASSFVARDYSPMTALFYVLGFVIITSPEAYRDPSCQLSFSATFGILACAPLLKKVKFRNKVLKYTCESVIISIGSTIATLPFVVYHFGSVSLISVISNLIILILVPALLLLSYIFSFMTLIVPGVAYGAVANLLEPVASAVNAIAGFLASFKFGYVPLTIPGLVIIFTEVISLVAIARLKSKKLLYSLALVFMVANAGFISYNIFGDEVTVSFLRVGQGDCTVIHSKDGSTFMIDCGSESEFSVGSGEVKPYLQNMGIDKVDVLFITHYHNDHINGAKYLIESGTVRSLVLPEREPHKDETENARDILKAALYANIPVHYASAGDRMSFCDKHNFEVIHPQANLVCDANNASMVLCYTYKKAKILFMGDTESRGQRLFADELSACDIIKVAHHGGKSTMSKGIYNIAKPKYALISCGENNNFGHPAKDTLDAFSKCKILRTDTSEDAIVFTAKNKGGKTNWKLR